MNNSVLFETEVPPKDIFKKMQKNVYDHYFYNSFLTVNKEYVSIRSSLLSIIHKVCEKMSFRSQTFFLCVQYLDIIFSKKQSSIPFSKYNIVGLACLCLSAKYCENDPMVPHLQYFIKVYNNLVRGGWKNALYKSDLFYFEVVAVKLLNYKLNYNTIYDFDSFFWGHGIVKIEQLTDIHYDGYSRSYSIKKVIEKIYKKSREYLDIVINDWKICIKYNPLMLSIYIMKKSVEDVLLNEKRFLEKDSKLKEKFIRKNNLCYQEIMYDFYKINYESEVQYKDIINDDEINKIFKNNEIRNLSPALACLSNQDIKIQEKINEKDNKENNNNEINNNKEINNNNSKKYNISFQFEGNVYSTRTHNSTAHNFYKRNFNLNTNKININDKVIENKDKEKDTIDNNDILNDIKENEKINTIAARNFRIKPKVFSKKKKFIEPENKISNNKNIKEEKIENIDDDLSKNLNIDELKNLKNIDVKSRISKYRAYANANNSRNNHKYSSNSFSNININNTNNSIMSEIGNSSVRQRYKKAISNIYYQKLTSNNNKSNVNVHLSNDYSNNINKSVDNNAISNSLSINNLGVRGKLIFQKKQENQKTIPLESDSNISKTNLNDYTQTQMNRYINNSRRIAHIKNLNTSNNNSIIANNSCNIEENKAISKPYFKKYAHQTHQINNNSNININNTTNNVNPNSSFNNTGNYFYSNSNSSRMKNLYARIQLRKNMVNNSINSLIEDENNTDTVNTHANANDINNSNVINNADNTSNQNTNNNSETSSVGAGSRYRRKKNPYAMNSINNREVKVNREINKNDGNSDNVNKEANEIENKDNKFNLTSSSCFYPRNINNNMTRDANELKSIEREFHNKKISYLLLKKNKDLNNTLKEINHTNHNLSNDLSKYGIRKNYYKSNKAIEVEDKEQNNDVDNDDNEKNKDNNNDEKKIMNKTGESWMSSRFCINNKYSSIRKRYRDLKNENLSQSNDSTISNNNRSNSEKEIEKNNKNNNKNNIDNIDNIFNNINSDNKYFYQNYKNQTIDNQLRSAKVNLRINPNNDNTPVSNTINIENKPEEPQSTFLKFINRTKALFSKKPQEKKSEITQDESNNSTTFNKTNNFFYKRRAFYNQNNNNNKTFDENAGGAKNTYCKSKISKEETNNQPTKNTIVINNNININIGNKINSNVNVNNVRMKYKMKREDTGYFDKNKNENNTINSNITNNINNKSNELKKENHNSTLNSLLSRIPFYKKYTANSYNNNVNNNVDNNININNINNNVNNNSNRNNNEIMSGSKLRRNLFG